MKKEYEEQYHRLEENHWWFRGRRHLVHALLLAEQPDRSSRILEIGCSGGPLMLQLASDGYVQVTGIDISPEAIQLCRERGITDAQVMDAQAPSFSDNHFDVITASDVLEHLANEPKALREWYRMLKPGGVIIVFVPAFMFLWSPHDVANKHQKRYRLGELRASLEAAGFSAKRCSYWNFLLFFPVTLVRLLKRLLPERGGAVHGDLHPPGALVNNCLFGLLRLENRWMRAGGKWPWGVSAMVVAQKPRAGPSAGAKA